MLSFFLQIKDIFFFLFFLTVWLVAYGVANQALLYSYDPRADWIFRRVLHKPYMHIYGLLPMEEVDGEWLRLSRADAKSKGATGGARLADVPNALPFRPFRFFST